MGGNSVTKGESENFATPISPLPAVRTHPLIYIAAAVYGVLIVLTLPRHEPWADEAQSWLLSRDASLVELWGRLLHYEGTPGLWQTILHALIRLGLPYSAYGFVSATLGLAAVILLLRYAPFPLFIRLLLPFTYYLCYQYSVIARSYALIAPILFGIAALYPYAAGRLTVMTSLLGLLAGISVNGFLLSAIIWLTLYGPMLRRAETPYRRRLAIAGLIYGCVLVFFLVCAWPANDVAFAEHRGLANLRLLPDIAAAGLGAAFTGYWATSLVLIALTLPLLWRGGGWLVFLLAAVAFLLFGTIVYTQLWHFGILFLAWIFAIWISAYKTRVTAPTIVALLAAIGFQCYWTASAIRYDWTHAYSGSLAAAQYLRETGIPAGGLYAIGYPSVSVQPYFPTNVYSDYRDGKNEAYWDWSKKNTAIDPAALFASDRRELVVVSYKERYEKQHWGDLLALMGYGLTQHFDGGTFWQTRVFEFESYDLYRKTSDPRATSRVNMENPAQAAQLLNGFYGIEGGKSRWTAEMFSVLLKAPPASDKTGAQLALKLYIPDVQIRSLGAMTLSATVGGHELPARTYSKAGEYDYSVPVPAEALRSGLALMNFRLDKSSVGLNGDARELGVIATEVALAPQSPAQ